MRGHSASSKLKIRILFLSSYFNEIIEENLEAVKKSVCSNLPMYFISHMAIHPYVLDM